MPARAHNPPEAPVATALPQALLDPHAYPHWPDEVQLRETHISWVFLAGERAYKVKKPVTLPFLDYGTLARRRELCAEEVQLNRRFAPSVYAGVVAIVPRGLDGLGLGPECDPRAVDYAVEMRRYDEDATLAARLAAGTVGESELTAIGEALARLHADAPRPLTVDGAEGLGPVVEETLATLAEAGVAVVDPDRLSALARFARAGLAGLAGERRARAAAGLVRECHGDLRAEHVLLDGGVELVDGVEFDPALRVTDVAYDLAFLVMDLHARDEALARALVRGYTRAGGDAGSERLLDFLVALRALVRAKVDLLRAAQLTGVAADRRRTRALALVALAERFAWRARLPRIVCVAGLTASGKSTLAAALGAAAQRPVISSDVVRKTAAGVEPEERLGAAHYQREVSREVYDALGHAARAAGGAIVDATFRHPDDVAAFGAAAGRASWIVCHAPPDVLLERAGRRSAVGGSASDADPAVVAGQIARSSGPLPLPAAPLAELETVRPVERLLEELAATLDAALARGEAPDA